MAGGQRGLKTGGARGATPTTVFIVLNSCHPHTPDLCTDKYPHTPEAFKGGLLCMNGGDSPDSSHINYRPLSIVILINWPISPS